MMKKNRNFHTKVKMLKNLLTKKINQKNQKVLIKVKFPRMLKKIYQKFLLKIAMLKSHKKRKMNLKNLMKKNLQKILKMSLILIWKIKILYKNQTMWILVGVVQLKKMRGEKKKKMTKELKIVQKIFKGN